MLKGILIYPRCIEVFVLIVIKLKLAFQDLPKWSCAQSLKNLEVDGFEVMEGLLIENAHLPIGVGLEW